MCDNVNANHLDTKWSSIGSETCSSLVMFIDIHAYVRTYINIICYDKVFDVQTYVHACICTYVRIYYYVRTYFISSEFSIPHLLCLYSMHLYAFAYVDM